MTLLWLVGAALLAWGVYQLRIYPQVGAGYRAKVVCTALFGSGRPLDEHLTSQIADDAYLILRPFAVQVDRTERRVTASLFGFFPRTAVHRDGLGATLLAGAPAAALGPAPAIVTRQAGNWPSAAGAPALLRVVDAAFEEPNPRRLRRTYAVLVVHEGRIVAERYACGITASTPMPGWSMTKSVLNALVGILVAEGRLRLDQRELRPEWRAPDPRSAITLEDLLRMRTGLRFSEAYGNPWSNVLRMLYRSHDMAACAAQSSLGAAPGSAWQYSSGTTNLLSSVVRRTVGDSGYHAWPRRALFDRLGMDSAVMEPDGAGTFVCSSYMLATARDWARLGQLFVDGGRANGAQILDPEWIRFSTTPTPQSPDSRFGAHWWLKLNEDIGGGPAGWSRIAPDAFFAVGHEAQTLTVIPSKGLVIVRLGASIHIDAWNQARFVADVQDAV
jgi:CubicO group peptidase (beta-lactamase class C family)